MKDAFQTICPLILASGSPRRHDFLTNLGLDFTVRVADIAENCLPGEKPKAFVERMALEKARAVAALVAGAWVLAADTVVAVDEQILGKPEDEAAARRMLMLLAGRWHQVWTGFCLCCKDSGEQVIRSVCTEVCFIPLSPNLCAAYVATGEPLDKAGSYGIQGRGGFLVKEIRGSYTNVVGLPLAEVLEELLRLGIIAPNAG
ncbi:MAG: Maf family protein [Desulfobulbaceae bacterium]|nr:Maf family protein [Desulfobulbaceae bacterium]HIJ77740.1 septum formation inhibitor Maf [Deltaproteobacteria bacterium]